MAKRKPRINSSDSSSSESDNSDLDSEFLNLAKKRKIKPKSNRSCSEHSISENISSSESSHEEFNDGYGSDFMGDVEDREILAQMTEKEREQEIFKRIEAREVLKTRFNIEKKLRQQKRREMKKLGISNRKTDQSYKKEKLKYENREKYKNDQRSSKHYRDDKKYQKLDQKRVKEDWGRDSASDESKKNKTKLKASDVYSDDSDSSSEGERIPRVKQKSKNIFPYSFSNTSSESESEIRARSKKQYLTSREQLNQIRLSRQKLEQFLHLPFFKRIVVGCFVRVITGSVNNKSTYRICEITDVTDTDTSYQLRHTKTNKNLCLKHGKLERTIRIEFVSNQEFTEVEFKKWRKMCTLQGHLIPTTEEVLFKTRDIKEAVLFDLKEEDIEKMIRRKERFKSNPHNYAVKKNQLMNDRDVAQSKGDTAQANKFQTELQSLEKRTAEIDKLRTMAIANINYLNNRNRKKNAEFETTVMTESKFAKDQKSDDPFTRKQTKPSMVFRKKDPYKEDSDTYHSDKNEKNEFTIPIKRVNPQKQGEDMYSAHDFDIKIEFDVPAPINPPHALMDEKVFRENSSKKSLNLEDYKKRKGFI